MQLTREQVDAFLAGEPLPGACFVLNEEVSVVEGQHRGALGSIVAVEQLGVDPIYVVELATGNDIRVAQSWLRSARA
jgi:hypothetical protein